MWTGFGRRLTGALRLDESVYAEIARDEHATGPALAVVVGSAAAAGLGRVAAEGAVGLLASLAQGCVGFSAWLLGVALAARVAGSHAPLSPLFRVLGFAAAPFALGAFDGLPWIGGAVLLAKWALGLAAAVTALRAAFRVSLAQALVLCVGGLMFAILLTFPLLVWLPV